MINILKKLIDKAFTRHEYYSINSSHALVRLTFVYGSLRAIHIKEDGKLIELSQWIKKNRIKSTKEIRND